MHIKRKESVNFLFLFCCFAFISTATAVQPEKAQSKDITERFSGYTWSSQLKLEYPDLDRFYSKMVLESGLSERERAKDAKPRLGTRLRDKVNLETALEANRFYFEAIENAKDREVFSRLRESLQNVTRQVPLNLLNRKEQLAYWLNLYNIGMLEKLAAIYPEKDLEAELHGEGNMLDEAFISVDGVRLSLNDIQHKIVLPRFRDKPNVIYGFYQGHIGSPSLLTSAYRGENVYKALEQNAIEFINSNRGTRAKGEHIRVSRFYSDNGEMFPNFSHDLKAHLMLYATGDMRDKIADAEYFEPTIEDWHVTDVFGTMRNYGGASANNPAAFIDALKYSPDPSDAQNFAAVNTFLQERAAPDSPRFTPEQLEILTKLKRHDAQNRGSVSIKDLVQQDSKQQGGTDEKE